MAGSPSRLPEHLLIAPGVAWHPGKHALEFVQRGSDLDPALAETQLANRVLMLAVALFHDRNRFPDPAGLLEITQEENGVGEVCEIDRRAHLAQQSVLGDRHDGDDSVVRKK